jgi:hypothetical protein
MLCERKVINMNHEYIPLRPAQSGVGRHMAEVGLNVNMNEYTLA